MSEVFTRQHIEVAMALPDKEAYLKYIAARTLALGIGQDEKAVYEGLAQRENDFSTNLGGGVAIPHTKSTAILKPAILLLKPKTALDCENEGEEAVRVILCIVSNETNGANAHLELLASLARKLIDEEFKQKLLESYNVEDLFVMVQDALNS